MEKIPILAYIIKEVTNKHIQKFSYRHLLGDGVETQPAPPLLNTYAHPCATNTLLHALATIIYKEPRDWLFKVHLKKLTSTKMTSNEWHPKFSWENLNHINILGYKILIWEDKIPRDSFNHNECLQPMLQWRCFSKHRIKLLHVRAHAWYKYSPSTWKIAYLLTHASNRYLIEMQLS